MMAYSCVGKRPRKLTFVQSSPTSTGWRRRTDSEGVRKKICYVAAATVLPLFIRRTEVLQLRILWFESAVRALMLTIQPASSWLGAGGYGKRKPQEIRNRIPGSNPKPLPFALATLD